MIDDTDHAAAAARTAIRASLVDAGPPVPKPPAASIGDILHGKYRVERVIGEGGMGLVVAAKHLTLDRYVALKLLSAKGRDSGEALERFRREAQAAASIRSEHVGRIIDVDTLANGTPFIVMELLEGHDLAEELRRESRVPVEQAVTWLLQACEAVAEAHAAGIVHRDLKPANLFLSRTPTGSVIVKVLDFGISKITRNEPTAATTQNKALTSPSTMLGSPLYMSPEQMKASGDVDARTDIWSFGVILYELVTGLSPFDGTTIPMICANVLSQPPPPLPAEGADALVLSTPGGPGVDKLQRVLVRCLEKDPSKRYRDISHLVRALAPFAPEQGKVTLDRLQSMRGPDGFPVASPASILPPAARDGAGTITSWGEPAVAAPTKKWLPLVIAGGLVAAIAAAAIVVTVGRRADPASVATSPEDSPVVESTDAALADEPTMVAPVVMSADAPTSEPSSAASAAAASSANEPAAPVPAASPPRYTGKPWPPPKPAPTVKPRTAGFGERE